jgi:hypothetical protein
VVDSTDRQDDEPEGNTAEELRFLLERQRDLVTAIATGTSITDGYTKQYRDRRRKLKRGLERIGRENPFPWPDLYQWWAHCKRWPTYQERRTVVSQLSEPILDQLETATYGSVIDWSDQTEVTWPGLEARLGGLKQEFEQGTRMDDWQDVGRRAREIMIDAADLVFETSMVPPGEEMPKAGNAKTRLTYYVQARSRGESHADLRRLIQASWDLATTVTHSTNVTRAEAFAAAQAAILLVRTLEQMEAPA